ncbi:hypothetical protein BAUCODRAFT_108650 [Baudoinia panamericana UAMH 10762]|uniref:Rhodopsin domain-containing protein n=1 Tax=Baudoinia panamericana (strain UAMH 10762) TaxID=717646 RepID=M2NC58_BAUPA|nr:uncharacterized protein BAUCODRAFT_108650 [Baudoinia panamericana UAMH 10762]EMC96759.1 hypothetical protein BAUCODRAFT_108650 [Baudoinia panamericana UAMH 10762]
MVALVIESWIWYGVVVAVAASRIVARRMLLGSFKRFQVDDYLMLAALCFYTTLIATINIVRYVNSNLLPPGFDVNSLSPQDIEGRVYGSKLILVVEQCQCCTVWLAKACLLTLYLRLTTLRSENIILRILCGYVAFGFIFMEVFYFGVWCQPFHNYWAVPTPNVQCDAATNHLITNAFFNLTSDCCMLAIGLPMFLRLNLQWKKKVPVIGLFSLGIFVILAAVLNKVYSFSEPFGAMWTYWYVRESSTALLVANLPFVWTLWRTMAGLQTVKGGSGQGTVELTQTMSRGEKMAGSLAGGSVWRRQGSEGTFTSQDEELARGQRSSTPGDLTLDEMLMEGKYARAIDGDEEVSPYTHPSLYYARGARLDSLPPKALVSPKRNGGEQEVVRRDSGSPERSRGSASFSSASQNPLGTARSIGSFV